MMIRIWRLLAVILCGTLLAGCHLVSKKPLLPREEGVALFGESFSSLAESGGSAIGSDGSYTFESVRLQDTHYVSNVNSDVWLSFHRLFGFENTYILQRFGPDETVYYIVRLQGSNLSINAIDVNTDMLKALDARGIAVESIEEDGQLRKTVADSRHELEATLALWANTRLNGDPPKPDQIVRVATDPQEQEAMYTKLATHKCLSLAGHAVDPALKALPTSFRDGVPMGEIEVGEAKVFCTVAAAASNNPSISYALARIAFQDEDYDVANPIIDDLIEQRFPLAFVMRADQFTRGAGQTRSISTAKRLLSSEGPDSAIIHHYRGVYLKSSSWGDPDVDGALKAFQAAAGSGLAVAETELGRHYRDGAGVPKDEARSYRLFQQAADGGDRFALYERGYAEYFGVGTEQDRKKAFKSYKAAADRGVVTANYPLGFMYAWGQGQENNKKNPKLALNWLEKASAAGNVAAKGELGRMIYYGEGGTADQVRGRKLMEEAKESGDRNSESYLAQLATPPRPKLPDAPESVAQDVDRLARGEPFKLTEVNMPFMAGMATHLHGACKLPSDSSDRAELLTLAMNGAAALNMGMDYSNPNLGKAIGSMAQTQVLFAGGKKFAEELDCRSPVASTIATGIAKASRSAKQSADGGTPIFIRTCSPVHSETKCTCLAQVGRSAIPDIHQRRYSRDLVYNIIQRNPMLGFMIGGMCQVINY